MNIAVATENGNVAQHFGHCEGFILFEAENSQLFKKEIFPNPGHKHGVLPNLLNEKGIDVVISGGMGEGAMQICTQKGMEVVIGAQGDAVAAVNSYVKGELKTTGSTCKGHKHQHKHKHKCH